MRHLALITLIVFCYSCGNNPRSQNSVAARYEDSIRSAIAADSVQRQLTLSNTGIYKVDSAEHAAFIADVMSYDTITPHGNFIKHLVDSADNVFIAWGSKSGGIIDTIAEEGCGWSGTWAAYIGETDQQLVIRCFGKGYPHIWLLPLSPHDSVAFISGVIDLDIANNLILTTASQGELKLTNFASGKSVHFDLNSLHTGMYGLYEIDSISFRKDAVYLEWQGEDEKKHSQLQKL